VDKVGTEVSTRDSILLTYFVDDTPWQRLSNRFKRGANLVATQATRLVKPRREP